MTPVHDFTGRHFQVIRVEAQSHINGSNEVIQEVEALDWGHQ